MRETLGELWQGWAAEPSRGPLALAFALLVSTWFLAVAITFQQTRRAWRSQAAATPWVLAVPLAFATAGILQPSSFHSWALVGLGLAPVLAFLSVIALRQTTAQCPHAHRVVPSWPFCPWCPSVLPPAGATTPPVVTGFVGRGIATLLRRPEQRQPDEAVEDQTEVLLRLVPDAGGPGEVVIRQPGATIGRNPDAHVWVDDPTVSWEHAKIVSRDGAPALIDLASSNGTYVNNERVESSLLLADDRVQFGGVVFWVHRP